MFRRSRTDTATTTEPVAPLGPAEKKGRPTPTRREAEAAARERARTSATGTAGKARPGANRQERAASAAKVREGMRNGDERYLPKRDKGPVRRFVRDFVDRRISIAEFLLPFLVLTMALQYSRQPQLASIANTLQMTVLLVIAVDTVWLVFRLRRALRAKFEADQLRGTTTYAILRMVQMRMLRMPKPQVKVGGAPR